MKGLNNEVWVTSALTDEVVRNALVLCYSLKRALTTRRVAVIVSQTISKSLREKLYYAFDLVFFVEEEHNSTELQLDDFTKLSAFAILASFNKAVYLSPTMVVVRNADEIFGEYDDDSEMMSFGEFVISRDMELSIFLFKPSMDLYDVLTKGIQEANSRGDPMDLASYLKVWTGDQLNQGSVIQNLDGKYTQVLQNGKMLLGNERDISILNFVDSDPLADWNDLNGLGLLGKCAIKHWLKVYQEDVKPLMESSSVSHPMSCSTPSYVNEPIAIVGMSCRFPGSNNLKEFWNLLFNGEDGTCAPPSFRWLREQCSRPQDCRNTNAGFLKVPVDEFDAKFFGLSPKEMISMDPQHRLLHELVWEGLEDACIDAHSLKGSPGSVFIGSWTNDYGDILVKSGNDEFYRVYMGNSIGAAAARISHLLGMVGPSVATESGCSSAMVAVHLACRSLQLGESNIALAAGVNLLLHPFDKDVMPMVISPDGHCKTFCEKANGFARAEGCGVLVLKRLSDAVKDGDNIWAMIRGSAIAQEGVSKSMGTPTIHCEALAMRRALRDAHVDPEQVSYLEAHGTGTVVGDPMEISAIANAYNSKKRKEPLVIGSVKTNVGHTESCSGITGIMKVVLAMHNEVIPAHRNFTRLNPSIDLNAVPAVIPLEPVDWLVTEGRPRLAGVSSFGITGTEAHVIVEESPKFLTDKVMNLEDDFSRPLHILKLSAKTEEALNILLDRYQEEMSSSDLTLEDIAYAANTGRSNFNQRAVIIAKSKEELVANLQQKKILSGEVPPEEAGKICFLFTGQGSQYPGMAKQLYNTSPIFRIHFDLCEDILRETYHIDIKQALWGPSSEEINRTIYSQTAIFCVEYALLQMWNSWGIKADYALGHSLGEFAAAVCAGFISVKDALMLVAERSRLIDQIPRGKMLVIKASQQEVGAAMERFGKALDYAAVNSHEQTVVAGDSEVVLDFSKFCLNNGLKSIILEATHAFHSKHMNPILGEYKKIASTVEMLPGVTCKYISGVRGKVVQADEVNSEYWEEHTREKVSFLRASKTAVELSCKIFIEIGPQPVLTALTMMNNDFSLLCLPSLKRMEDEWVTILNTLGKLYLKGVPINWEGFDQFYLRKKVRLPHYPFIGKKFWPDMMALSGASIHPLLGSPIPNASSTKLFQCGVNLTSHEYIKDHHIGQNVVFPGAGYLEICLAAGLACVENSGDSLGNATRPMKIEDLRIEAPLSLEESKTRQIQTIVKFNNTSTSTTDWNDMSIQIFHRTESESLSPSWLSHAIATFSPLPTAEDQEIAFDCFEFKERLLKESDPKLLSQIYEEFASVGLKFGPTFKSMEHLWRTAEDSTLLAKVKLPPQDDRQCRHIIHPVVLDAMLQAIIMLKLTSNLKKKLYVPIKIGKFVWLARNATEETYIWVYDTISDNAGDELSTASCIALLLDGEGKVLAIMSQVEVVKTTVRSIEAVLEQQTNSMPDLWEESWHGRMGPMQHRQNLEICNAEKFYDEPFRQDLMSRFNNLDEDLNKTFQQLEKLSYCNMLRAMFDMGWVPPPQGTEFSQEALLKALGVQMEYCQLFGYYLEVLQIEGVLTREQDNPDKWKLTGRVPTLEQVLADLSLLTTALIRKFKVTILFNKVGENLAQILTGKQSPLYILFPDDSKKKDSPSVLDFYADYGATFKILTFLGEVSSKWLEFCKDREAASGEKFVLRVLEIGAGTGMLTRVALECYEAVGIEFEHTYTDISPAFFPPAEKMFEKYAKNLTFRKLNIEEDPISQGFIPEYYDCILASDVIHATRDISETLSNVKALLKPMGRFDMVEMTKVNRAVTYLFGLLDGFWRFEDKELRPSHCTLSTEKWVETFNSNGFEVAGTFPSVNEYHSYICTRKAKNHPATTLKPSGNAWIIFHQKDSAISNFLIKHIQSVTNRQIFVVQAGDKFESYGNSFTVRRSSEQDFISVLETVGKVEGIIYCWSLDKHLLKQENILQPYFYMVKSINTLTKGSCPRLVTLSDGIIPVEDNSSEHIHPSTIWGFTKSLCNEKSELSCRLIDIGGAEGDVDKMMQIFYEIWNPEKATQVVYLGATRYTPKIQPHKPTNLDLKLPSGTDRFKLILPETKSIADLQFGPLDPFVLGEDEIEMQVKATALNFRDVLNILKPSEEFKNYNSVGFDIAGVVKRVGPKVTKWSVGDSIFGLNVHGDPFPSHVKLSQDDVLPVWSDMTFCEAATLPAVFATAYHCLVDVAKVKKGETVLLHTASGGVGLSAIEVCKHLGANIICTAGSKRKQTYLKFLGIQHIFHSRNTNYGKDILEVTGGRGVDVVLNSLTSEGFKEATLKACAKNARFVEMSKLSIWESAEVQKLRPDVDYSIVDVSSLGILEWRGLMKQLMVFGKNKIVNPIPYVRFDGVGIREALQYLQKAKHIGKVVCVMPEVKHINGQTVVSTPMFNPQSTYLITGGLGGIGFVVCQWMVGKGAKHVLLAGRNPPNSSTQQCIAQLNAQHNAKVTPVQLDVSDFTQCKDLIQTKIAQMGYPPLRGVMHCAGTLHDGLIQNQHWPGLSSTLQSKVDGTINLHELTKDLRLEHFVLFSSIAALIGSPGQSNYAAGNNFEDIFAHYRNSIGLPATTINWGQWGQVGISTEIDFPGLKPFSNLQGISGLEYALKSQRTQIGVFNIESLVVLTKLFPHITSYLDERLWKAAGGSGSTSLTIKSDEFWQRYDSTRNEREGKVQVVQEVLRSILKNVLGLDEADIIQEEQNFQEMGVDSLMFVEIKNALQAILGDRVTVHANALRDCNNVKLLSETLVALIEGDQDREDHSKPPTSEEVSSLIREDSQLPEHIYAREGQTRVTERDIKIVLLTGCTGTLGPYILKELCSLPQISKIICLVRSTAPKNGEQRLRNILEERDLLKEGDFKRITVVLGDVASPKLGMEPETWEELSDQVEAIFHCAASVQHVEHYRKRISPTKTDMRRVNVEGTKNILEFSCTGGKLKHVFHASGLIATPKGDKEVFTAENWPELGDFDNVTTMAYPITKFVGDLLLKEAILNRGIPGKVFRFPLIVGDSQTGRFVLSQNHLMLRYLFILKHGMMPCNPLPLYMLPVDTCAGVGVKLFFDERCGNDIINVTHHQPALDQQFVEIAKRLGYSVDIVEFSQFAQKVMESSTDDSPFAIFKEFYRNEEDLMSLYTTIPVLRQWMLEGGSDQSGEGNSFQSRKIVRLLPEFYNGLEGTMEFIHRDLLFARKQGWLQKYGLK